jgi:hypothetical protein
MLYLGLWLKGCPLKWEYDWIPDTLICWIMYSNAMTAWNSSPTETTHHHSVAMQHLVLDILYRTGHKKSLKIPKGQSESVYRRKTDNTMAKRKNTKGQTTIYKRVHFMQCSTKLTCIFLTIKQFDYDFLQI